MSGVRLGTCGGCILAGLALTFATTFARAAEDVAPSTAATQTAPEIAAPSAPETDPAAPTTQPARRIAAPGAPAGWVDTVTRFASVACGKDLRAFASMLGNGPILRTFASDDLQLPERLMGATTGSSVLAMHVYPRVPATLATDLADDFRNAANVPDAVRAPMIPVDEAASKRANETAAAWLVQLLQPAKDQPVAVTILWRQSKTDTYAGGADRPIFVLMKGSETTTGQYVFRQITFGDPLDAPK